MWQADQEFLIANHFSLGALLDLVFSIEKRLTPFALSMFIGLQVNAQNWVFIWSALGSTQTCDGYIWCVFFLLCVSLQ